MITPSPASIAAQAQAELITQPLYDREAIANGATSATFFDGANANNRLLTNVDQNGQLPHPKFFRCGGWRLVVDNPAQGTGSQTAVANHVNDLVSLLYDGWFTFTLGGLKNYIEAPNFFFPGGVGPVVRSGNTTAYSANNGAEHFSSFMRLKHWLSVPPLQSFQGKITFPTAVVLNATTNVWLICDGELGREVL